MGVLRDEDYERLAKDMREGGFSVRPATGQAPKRGYMVSEHGHEERVPPPVTGRDIASYVVAHHAALSPRAKYLGGWNEGEADVLDVSRRFVTGRDAYRFAQANAQEALYNVTRGSTPEIPYGPRIPRAGRSRDELRAVQKERNARYRGQNLAQIEARAQMKNDPAAALQMARDLGEKIYEDEQWVSKQQ